MTKSTDIEVARKCLDCIDPSQLDYNDWLAVGMALHEAGGSPDEWEQWSRRDAKRYRNGEAGRKWRGFGKGLTKAGIGSMVKLARDHGGDPDTGRRSKAEPRNYALEWDDEIGGTDELVVVSGKIEESELVPPQSWNPCHELKRYLDAVFQPDETVCYVTDAWQSQPDADGKTKWMPKKGVFGKAGELVEELSRKIDLGAVVGDHKPEVGAWIRFNPMDGQGFSDINVTAFRHALVECDDMPVERQLAIIRELELPCAAIVHSGGKSCHAIVRIDAPDYKEYSKRVDFLYDVCKRNGLVVDRKNRNPSRLSRMPGATRNGNRQWIIDTNTGKTTWGEWSDWVAAANDDLPEVENMADVIFNLPPLTGELIEGLLRKGHKMLLAGPSKAGKSFLLLQLAIAIAEGLKWCGWKCVQGRVLYVNLELDPISCMHRVKDVYAALGIDPANAANIDIWNLRGRSMPMDLLAPKLIRRAMKKRYACVIIDPIYKVITGDESAADQMAKFCNMFDRIASELGAACIYCHHHSKGDQGQKRASDRASGSGVFARDPDALIDMIELEIDDRRRKAISDRWACDELAKMLTANVKDWQETVPQDDAIVLAKMAEHAVRMTDKETVDCIVEAAQLSAESASAWRIEGILREFKNFKARRMFFRYPTHRMDDHDLLKDALASGEEPPRQNREAANEKRAEKKKSDTWMAVNEARLSNDSQAPVTVADVAEYMHDSKTGEQGITEKPARTRLKAAGFIVKNGYVLDAGTDQNDDDVKTSTGATGATS